MTSKQSHGDGTEETGGYVNKALSLTRESAQAFDVLKARQGPRSGPRLACEAVDLLLMHYGEKPVGPMRPGAAKKTAQAKPKGS